MTEKINFPTGAVLDDLVEEWHSHDDEDIWDGETLSEFLVRRTGLTDEQITKWIVFGKLVES